MQSLEHVIAILKVEASMIESHADKLVRMASVVTDLEQQHQLLQLAEEEKARAETIRHQIRLLQDHLGEEDSDVA